MIQLRRETIPVDVLEEIVTLGEGFKTEFKATLPAPLAVAKSICAFSNTKGGNLFVGINDSSVPVGVINKDYELNKLEKALPLLLPNPDVSVKILGFRNAEIILIEVREGSDKPYFVKNGENTQAFVRTGSSNLPANKRAIKRFLGGRGERSGNLCRDEKVVYDLFQRNSRLKISQIRESLRYPERRVLKILDALARRGLLTSPPGENSVFTRTQDAPGQPQRERGFRGE